MATQIQTNVAPIRRLLLRGVKNWQDNKEQPSTDFPFPETDETEVLQLRLSGQTRELTFKFELFDNNTDVSDGTNPATIKTVAEQYAYVMDTIFRKGISEDWTITDTTAFLGGKSVVIERITLEADEFPIASNTTGTMVVKFGDAI